MAGTQLTLTIIGSDDVHGRVRFDEFFQFCESVYKCLRISEQIVSAEPASIEYRIADLKYGSATIKLEAVRVKSKRADRRAKAMSFFRKTVSNLQRGKVDPRIPPSDLGTFRELAEPLKRDDVKRVVIGRTSLTKAFDKTISKLLDESISSEGSVSGILERLNVHEERNEFVIYPIDDSNPITCHFPERLLDSVRKAAKRHVTVSGIQFYRHGSALPYRVHAAAIDIHPPDSELPSLHDVRALGLWDTGGLTAVEFLRAIRNEQA